MPRGGARKGKVGGDYPNRTDMSKVQAPKAPSGQGYGQAGAQLDAQKAIPLPNATNVTVNRGADGRISGVNVPQPTPQAPAGIPPGSLPPLNSPTDNPGEPLTSGTPGGPGPGPEALQAPDPLVKGAAFLNSLGSAADPATQRLRAMVNAAAGNQAAV